MVKSIVALIVSIIAVHLAYIGFIRPEAQLVIEAARAAGQSAPRDFVVILKDYEQEICVILMFWGIWLIGAKCAEILGQRYLFDVDLLDSGAPATVSATAEAKPAALDAAGVPVAPVAADLPGSDVPGSDGALLGVLQSLENLPEKIRASPLVHTLTSSLRRYLITGDVHNTSEAIESSVETLATKQEAENAMIRYLIWAIPSIGFIGTVRGIGQALSQADQALAGDIAGMTESLGIAFNSTFVALLISIGLMFLLNQLQRLQDGLVVDTQDYCESFLLKRLSTLRLDRLRSEGRR